MGFFSRWSKSEDITLVFDIGDASVGGALVLREDGAIPRVLYTVRTPIRPSTELDLARLTTELTNALREVITDIEHRGLRQLNLIGKAGMRPGRVMCVLAPLWHASHSRKITIARGAPFRITESLVNETIEREIKKFTTGHADAHIRAGMENGTLKLLERNIVHATVNGYPVENPQGLSGKNTQLLLYVSVAQSDIIATAAKEIQRTFASAELCFRSSTFVLFRSLRELYSGQSDFIMAHVGGEVTSISVVNSGALLETATFPIGKNTIVRDGASALDITPREADALMYRTLQRGKEGQRKELPRREADAMNKAGERWARHFGESLSLIAEGVFLPHNIFVIAEGRTAPWFVDTIEHYEGWGMKYLGETPKPASVAAGDWFAGSVALSEGVRSDPLLLLAALCSGDMV